MRYPNLTSNRFAPPFVFLLHEESELNETEWLQAAAANSAFDFLKDPEEGIYTLSDGRPFHEVDKVVLVPFPFEGLQGDQGTTCNLPDRSHRRTTQ